MLSIHFNKQVFINSLKTNDSIIYGITTLALMMTLFLQGMIKGNLKPEYFAYALIVSMAFCAWGIIDGKLRDKFQNNCMEKMDE